MIGPMCAVIMENTIPIDSQFSMLKKKRNSNSQQQSHRKEEDISLPIMVLTFTYLI